MKYISAAIPKATTGFGLAENQSASYEIPSHCTPNYVPPRLDAQGSFVPPESGLVFQATQALYIFFDMMGPDDWREVLNEEPSPAGAGFGSIGDYGANDNSVESCVYRMARARETGFTIPVEGHGGPGGHSGGAPVVHVMIDQYDNAQALSAWENVTLERTPGRLRATFLFLDSLIELDGRREGELFGKFKEHLVRYANRLLDDEPILA